MGQPLRLAGLTLLTAVVLAWPGGDGLVAEAPDVTTELQEAANSALALEVWCANNLRYMPGEPILLGLTFRNTGPEPVTVDMGTKGRSAIEVVFERRTHKSALADYGGLTDIYRATLTQGDTYHHSILLNEWLSFKQPGTYHLWILYDGSKGFTREASPVTSACDLTVTIVPKWGGHLKNILGRYCETVMQGARNVGADAAQKRAAASAVCFSGVDEALPFLSRMIDARHGWGGLTGIESFKGIRRVGTLAAVELLAELMNSDDALTAHLATVEIGLIEQSSEDPAVKARAQELLKDVPEDFRFTEPSIAN